MKKIIVSAIILGLLLSGTTIAIGETEEGDGPVEYWGITISTSSNGWDNFALVLSDILCENGWREDHIKALSGSAATYGNVVDALVWLENNADGNDKVLFHHMGHGGANAFTLNDNYMLYSELDQYLDDVAYDGIMIILNGCVSVGAIPHLQQEGRVILTATDADHTAWGTWFSEFCFIGLQGFADFEGNNTEWTSAEELFDFVETDTQNSNPNGSPPLISDNYDGELDIAYFNYINDPGLMDQYNVHDGGYGHAPLYASNWKAQSFKPVYPVLSGVMLYIGNKKGDPGPITVSIKEDLLEDDLCSVTVDQDNFYSNAFKFHTFDLPDITVTPGQEYWIVLKTFGENFDNCYFTMSAGNNYTEGGLAVSYDQGTSWTMGYYNYKDMYFATLGRPIDDPPLKPSMPSGPTFGMVGLEYFYTTTSTDPNNDQLYYKWDWGDGTYSDWLGPYESGEIVETSHTWTCNNTYDVRVKAKDIYCAESEWSDILQVTMWNDPPDPPTITGPLSGTAGEEYEYTFTATDPDGDDVFYYIDWGDDVFEEWIGPYTSGEEIDVTHIWDEQGTYEIKAKAKDIYGAESEWGELEVTMPVNQISAKSVAVIKSIQTMPSPTMNGMKLLR